MDKPAVGFAVAKHADVSAGDVSSLIAAPKAGMAPTNAPEAEPKALDAQDAPEEQSSSDDGKEVSADDAANELAKVLSSDDSSAGAFLQRSKKKTGLVSIKLH